MTTYTPQQKSDLFDPNTKVWLVEVKKGGLLQTIFETGEFDRKRRTEAFYQAAEDLYAKGSDELRASYRQLSETERHKFIVNNQEEITHRIFIERVQEQVAQGNIIDHGNGGLYQKTETTLNQEMDKINEAEARRVYTENAALEKQATTARKIAHAYGAYSTGPLRKLEKVLNSPLAASAFLAFEIFNIKSFYESMSSLEKTRGSLRTAFGMGSVALDALVATSFLVERTTIALGISRYATAVAIVPKFFSQSIKVLLGSAGLLLFTALSLSDAYFEFTEGHFARGCLSLVLAAGTAAMFASGLASISATSFVFCGLGPVGWLGLALTVIALVGLYFIVSTDLEDWFQQGPFADFSNSFMANNVPNAKGHLQDPDEAYYRFLSLLSGIQISVENNPLKHQLRLQDDAELSTVERKIKQADLAVNIRSNLPWLNLGGADPQQDFATIYLKNRKYVVTEKGTPSTPTRYSEIISDVTVFHEQRTAEMATFYIRKEVGAASRLKIWVQYTTNIIMPSYGSAIKIFPAPPPSQDIPWNKSYKQPNWEAGNTDYWVYTEIDTANGI